MQMQIKTSDEFFEDFIICNANRDLRSVFSQSIANFLSSNQDEDNAIELDPEKTLFFGLF